MLSLLFAILFSIPVNAQQQKVKKEISFEVNNQRLSVVLKKIEELSDLKIVFNYEDVNRHTVSITARNESVDHLLNRIFRGTPFKYDLKDDIITIQFSGKKTESQSIYGTITTRDGDHIEVLPYAYITCITTGTATQSDENGKYVLRNLPNGKIELTVRYLGKLTVNKVIEKLTSPLELNFNLVDDNFMMKEVVVTARTNESGISSSSSVISQKAVEHLQANSLQDMLSLLPGGLIGERNLNNLSQVNLRSAVRATNNADLYMNALGTSIITDGAPVSNNANLQVLNPAVSGAIAPLGGGASPAGGADTRTIQMDNVESVEVIRGVPSVEYGDVATGVVIINAKAGVEPFKFVAKANRNLYEFTAGKGFALGAKKGALNVNLNYAHNVDEPHTSDKYYQRLNAKLIYSNSLLDNKWRTNTVLDLFYTQDRTRMNPDDELYKRASEGKNKGFRFNSNGQFYINKSFLRNFRYVLSANYSAKDSYSQENYSSANAPYSMTTTDGAILANKPGAHVYDVNGNEITNYGSADAANYAIYLPSTYFGQYNIEGRELNLFGKGVFTFFKKLGATNNRLMAGADAKFDKNYGEGKTFDPVRPPYRNLSMANASFRPRKYSDIPGLKQFGLFVEENFSYTVAERQFRLQAGLRYDHVSVVKDALSVRLNGAFEVIPHTLTLNGGYGVTAKAPTLLYLYPEKAYFEYINVNELTNEAIPQDDRVFMTTTRAIDTQNKELTMAKNKRIEAGFNLHVGQAQLVVTAFKDKMTDGYAMTDAYSPFVYNTYVREGNGFKLNNSVPVLSVYKTPGNSRTIKTKGVEFDLDLGRFDALRTAFSLNGAWTETKGYNNEYDVYDPNGNSVSDRKHIALYEKGLYKHAYERLSTAVRITHNIPQLGFVVTLTGQTIWKEADWYDVGNETMPVKYISKYDGKTYDFDPALATDPEFSSLIRNLDESIHIKESYSPLFCFNVNLTKHIGDFARLSFFANNMFRSYPVSESKRTPGSYIKRNAGLFSFGVELGLNF